MDTPLYLDIPRAIPAADPFNPLPELAEVGERAQALRGEMDGDPAEIDRQVSAAIVSEFEHVEDDRNLSVAQPLDDDQPRGPDGRWIKVED